MRRIERWIVTLLIVHACLLIGAQILINYSNIHVVVDPVYEYLGVFNAESKTTKKTIGPILSDIGSMLPF